ncbi:HlyD family efflux transporter periplasmic adaptor subunit [Saccharospirillum mangrovi]|uniref:HlyD family efflux transporter periplasmic adaptor subunit n=1 Tax=Saccharospirillum mangrovi TaxID=2161747 RepID=UPI000D37D572|nr:HlyD family efflux transporter periplasmic adaptor subunit [Saccharospirillum mangrovi]
MPKRPLIIMIVIVAVVGLSVWWTQSPNAASSGLTLHGNVDIRQVSLAFDGSGRIAELRVEEGDHVQQGDLMGVLDTSTLALQADQARAEVEVRRQSLLQLQRGTRPEEIARARAQLASAEASAAQAERELSRSVRLQASDSGAASAQNVDLARANAQIANAKVDELRAVLAQAEAGPRAEEVAAAQAALSAAEAQLALLQHQIDQGQLRAPVDAVVRSRLHEPGDIVTPQSAVFALALTEPKWIRVYIDEPNLSLIQPGMPADVLTDDALPALSGRVGYISSVAEFTPKPVQTTELRTSLVYEVRVVVDDPDDRLRLGQPASVQLQARTES